MTGFVSETDIANRALQRLGAAPIAGGALWTEDSQNAVELRRVYDQLRATELRRNVWRYSIRTQIVRPIDTMTYSIIRFPQWDARISYKARDIVYTPSTALTDGGYWAGNNPSINHDPMTRDYTRWYGYFGNMVAYPYDATVTFQTGEIVYDTIEDPPNLIFYVSVLNNNLNNVLTDATNWQRLSPLPWHFATSFDLGARAYYNGVAYVSLQAGNAGNQPDISPTFWGVYTDFIYAPKTFVYPIGAGPQSQTQTRNVYLLPNNYLRVAPQAPKQGSYQMLGFPSNLWYNDWQFEQQVFTTVGTGPIALRFAADIADPGQMDPMFIDGFACRLALETCERITQSVSKVKELTALYNKFMSDARTVNGIEIGPVEQPLDNYITVRY